MFYSSTGIFKAIHCLSHKISLRLFISLLGALVIFLCLSNLLYDICPSSTSLDCVVEFEQDNQLQIFYSPTLKGVHFNERDSVRSNVTTAGKKSTLKIPLGNAPIAHIRIDTGNKKGVTKLYEIKIHSITSQTRTLTYNDIFESFTPGHEGVELELRDDHVAIISKTNDPYILSTREFTKRPWALILIVPSLFALLFFGTLRNADAEKWKNIFLPKKKSPSHGTNFDALDGLRGFAALMVVGDHTCGYMIGMGAPGVWIFMALSGFLLAKPFIAAPERILSIGAMKKFFIRRSQRILPAYYFYILVVYVINGYFDLAFRHFLFLEGDGHLWVVPQEILFYLIVPVIFFINYLLLKRHVRLQILCILSLGICVNIFLTSDVFSLYGMANQKLRLYFGVFLFGVGISYFHEYIVQYVKNSPGSIPIIQKISSIAGIVLLFILVFTSTTRLYGGTTVYAHNYFGIYGAVAALLVLSITLDNKSFLNTFFSWTPLQSIGVVSFSFYLFHPLIMNVVLYGMDHFYGYNVSDFTLFVVTAACSYPFACLIFHTIENPPNYPGLIKKTPVAHKL